MAEGYFETPPWMKILIREPEDPLSFHGYGRSGGINVIDLANLHSCSFLATSDLGRMHEDGTFEVLGRFDHSDIRGCSLMVS
jgi:non-ribosomal peptide synthetase component F